MKPSYPLIAKSPLSLPSKMFPVKHRGTGLASSREFALEGGDSWHIPEEVPVAFVFNRRNYAVMMATPDDLTDFALGFALTERVVQSADDILSLEIISSEQGADLRFKITDEALERLDSVQRRRNMVGSASCGLCGLENADALFTRLPTVTPSAITAETAAKALSEIRKHQPLNTLTRTVHAAAWANLSGEIKLAREDVGRHNALDKLLGALALQHTDMASGFVVMSSRCSYEIVEKAARRGVGALACVSAPTAFALRKASEAGLVIYARSPDGAACFRPVSS